MFTTSNQTGMVRTLSFSSSKELNGLEEDKQRVRSLSCSSALQ